jgi:Tfp pilus assembly protein PilX
MNSITKQIRNEAGSMIVVAILILAVLTTIGIAGITGSNTERQIATSEQIHKMAFYAAEAGRSYIVQNPDLYYENNTTIGGSLSFPDQADASAEFDLSTLQSANGTVGYVGSSLPPRGSGYEVGSYKSHRYRITSNGWGPRNSQSRIEAGFYRIGF